jgi:uncharacterized protein (DUF2249 family)
MRTEPATAGPRIVDCRGLEPPEPMERVLTAISRLQGEEQVLMIIDREPRPLYRILERNGYRYHAELTAAGDFEILIWSAR